MHRRFLAFLSLILVVLCAWAAPSAPIAASVELPLAVAQDRPVRGHVELWTSCSQAANISAANPMGLGDALLRDGPLIVARNQWIPSLNRAEKALGRCPSFMLWMDKGQKLIPSKSEPAKVAARKPGDPVPSPAGIMAVDSYASLIASGTGHPSDYAPAYRSLEPHCEKLIVYHGAPNYEDKPGDLCWLAPLLESQAIPVFDAQGDCTTEEMLAIARDLDQKGREFYVEPFVAQQTLWFSRGTPCFVLLQTVRDTIRKNWSPATGAARDYPYVNVMIGDPRDIDEDEVNGYLERGWNVFVPLDTPAEILAKFNEAAAADGPPVSLADPAGDAR